MSSNRTAVSLVVALAAVVALAGVYVVWPSVGCGGDSLAIEVAGDVTVEAAPGSDEAGTVSVTFADDGRPHPLHPCDARGGDVAADRVRVRWTTTGGNLTVDDGNRSLTDEGETLTLRERTPETDTSVSLVVVFESPDGTKTVGYDRNVTL